MRLRSGSSARLLAALLAALALAAAACGGGSDPPPTPEDPDAGGRRPAAEQPPDQPPPPAPTPEPTTPDPAQGPSDEATTQLDDEPEDKPVLAATDAPLYAGPAIDWAVLGQLQAGQPVELLNSLDSWIEVAASDGLSGWVELDALGLRQGDRRIPASRALDPVVATVLIDGLAHRLAPSPEGRVLDELELGQELQVLGRSADGQWLAIYAGRPGCGPASCHLSGWVANDREQVKVNSTVPELPLYAGRGSLALFAAETFDLERTVVHFGHWTWAESGALRYRAGDGYRELDLLRDQERLLTSLPASGIVVAEDGRRLAAITNGFVEEGISGHPFFLVNELGEASQFGTWTPGCCHGIFLRDRGSWSPDGRQFLLEDRPPSSEFGASLIELSSFEEGRRTLARGSGASWTPDGYILYRPQGSDELLRVDTAGNPRPFARPMPGGGFAPSGALFCGWDPTGAHFTFRQDGQLFVYDIESNATHDLGAARCGARWSPNGDRLLFRHERALGIWLFEIASAETTLILPGVSAADWSPDGQRIHATIHPERDQIYTAGGLRASAQQRVYDLDGTPLLMVRTDVCPAGVGWSPDGSWFAIGDQQVDCN